MRIIRDMSFKNLALVYAYEKGYRVLEDGTLLNHRGIKIKGCYTKLGYHYFTIKCMNRQTNLTVHRLQAYQKYSEDLFKKGIIVRHLNSIKTDNSFNNIAIGTHLDNYLDNPLESRINSKSNIKYPHNEIIKDFKSGMSYSQIMLKYGIKSKGTVSAIVNKEKQ